MSTIASQLSAARALRDADARRGVTGVRSVQERRPAEGAGLRGVTSSAGQAAAVLHWGPEARSLARGLASESGAPSAAEESEPAAGAASEPAGEVGASEASGRAGEAVSAGEAGQDEAGEGAGGAEESEEHQAEVRELQQRDREVRTHEQAHKSAGGAYAGSIHLDYTTGPDGKRYASSGHVNIDVSPVKGDPEATLRKMQVVQRAATAPADPSGADRSVAAQAAATATQARAEMAAKRYSEAQKFS